MKSARASAAVRPRFPTRFALGLSAAVLAAFAIAYSSRRDLVLEERLQSSRELVGAVADDLEGRMATSREDALFLSSLDAAGAALHHAESRPAFERLLAAFLATRPAMLQARLLDLEGRERVRVERRGERIAPAAELQDKSERYYFTKTKELEEGGVFVSRIDLNVEHEHVELPPAPVVRFSAVVREGGAPIGVVVLNQDARPLLDGVRRWAQRTIGELVLIDGDGAYLSHPESQRLFGGRAMLATGEGIARDRPALARWALARGAPTWTDGDTLAARADLPGVDGAPQVVLALRTKDALGAAGSQFLALMAWLLVALTAAALCVLSVWRRGQAAFDRAQALSRTRADTLAEAAAALAHEVRNPLAAIVSSVSQLRAEKSVTPGDADSVRLMDIVISESGRLERTLDDFLGLARPPPARRARVDLRAVAGDVVALAQRDPLFAGHVRLTVSGPSLEVLADPDQLRQVLWNLVLNAGAASRKAGGAEVDVRVLETRAAESSTAIVEVVDSGPGLRATGSDRGSPARGGLGLIVASGIVAQHGGQLELKDTGHGTRASVILPRPAEGPDR